MILRTTNFVNVQTSRRVFNYVFGVNNIYFAAIAMTEITKGVLDLY